ncbi:hypothetical protein WG907_03685 [Sphingobium sp. AN558]|uniref:hypothetical protein n=1 Tax=Sphingobium sp. AN558 TaxID=3133442 RepID=UPI0030BA4DCB
MTTMSIGKAWEEALVFISREAALLFPVALLFIALPGLVLQELTPPELAAWSLAPQAGTMPNVPPSYAIGLMLSVILMWFGSLALFALASRPGISVAEALRLSLVRLPVLLGASLLAGGFVLLAVLLLAIPLMLLVGPAAPFAVIILVAGFMGTRLILLNLVVVDGTEGATGSIRHAWKLTKGHFWRLLGLLIILTLISAIAASAAQAVFGVLAGLVGGASAAKFIGGLAAAAASTVIQVYLLVMLARLYRQAEAG